MSSTSNLFKNAVLTAKKDEFGLVTATPPSSPTKEASQFSKPSLHRTASLPETPGENEECPSELASNQIYKTIAHATFPIKKDNGAIAFQGLSGRHRGVGTSHRRGWMG